MTTADFTGSNLEYSNCDHRLGDSLAKTRENTSNKKKHKFQRQLCFDVTPAAIHVHHSAGSTDHESIYMNILATYRKKK